MIKTISIPITDYALPETLGVVGRNADANFTRLEITGGVAGWQYKLDLQADDGTKNVLDLINEVGTLHIDFDGSFALSKGHYRAQLRSVGDVVWHSNISALVIGQSINAIDAFPAIVPTECAQMEARMTALKAAAETAETGAETAKTGAEKAKTGAESAESAALITATTITHPAMRRPSPLTPKR